MLDKFLFDSKANILMEKMLDKAALSQRVISANVANAGTPGYKCLGVSFEEKLRNAMRPGLEKMKRTNPRHLPENDALKKVKPETVQVNDGYWNGINNVNIDEQMVELAKNQIDFNTAAKILGERFNSLRTAIRGRK